jgi:hypothetical protein
MIYLCSRRNRETHGEVEVAHDMLECIAMLMLWADRPESGHEPLAADQGGGDLNCEPIRGIYKVLSGQRYPRRFPRHRRGNPGRLTLSPCPASALPFGGHADFRTYGAEISDSRTTTRHPARRRLQERAEC